MGNSNKVKSSPNKSELNREEQRNHNHIESQLVNEFRNYTRMKKLVLIGTGSSRKSTILRQLSRIYKYGFMQSHYDEAAPIIRRNCISATITLLRKTQELYDIDEKEYQEQIIYIIQLTWWQIIQ